MRLNLYVSDIDSPTVVKVREICAEKNYSLSKYIINCLEKEVTEKHGSRASVYNKIDEAIDCMVDAKTMLSREV